MSTAGNLLLYRRAWLRRFYWDNSAWTFHQHRFKANVGHHRICLAVHNLTGASTRLTGMFDEVTMKDMARFHYRAGDQLAVPGRRIPYTPQLSARATRSATTPSAWPRARPACSAPSAAGSIPRETISPPACCEQYGEDGTMHFGLHHRQLQAEQVRRRAALEDDRHVHQRRRQPDQRPVHGRATPA